MAQKLDKPPPDLLIAALAAGQHELVTRVQLLGLGLDDRAIRRRVRAGRLHWGLLPVRGPRIDVTVPGSGGRARRGAIIVHRSPLPAADVTVKDGIAVTTPARTLIDLADLGDRRELERAYDEACDHGSTWPASNRDRAAAAAACSPGCWPSTSRAAPAPARSSRTGCCRSAASTAFPSRP
jgi:hypothetical protein